MFADVGLLVCRGPEGLPQRSTIFCTLISSFSEVHSLVLPAAALRVSCQDISARLADRCWKSVNKVALAFRIIATRRVGDARVLRLALNFNRKGLSPFGPAPGRDIHTESTR